MTDRESIMATFKAVAALYHRLTGDALVVKVETERGIVVISETVRPETLSRLADDGESPAKRFQVHPCSDEA